MKDLPLVSVIIPAYNASSYIEETISSVIKQDYKAYEIIVVDDGSTDNTADIVNRFGGEIKYIYKLNGGQSSARNAGIKDANGKYVAFIDSDDLWEKEKLRIQIELLEKTKAKWVYCDCIAFDGKSGQKLYKFSDLLHQYDGDVLRSLFRACFITSPTPIVHRSVFNTVGLFNEKLRYGEDWEMWLRIAAVFPVALVPLPLARYRVHSTSVTGRLDSISANNDYVTVIEEAVLRESGRLSTIKNSTLSNYYFRTGRSHAFSGDSISARSILLKSMKLTPFRLFIYLFWIVIPIAPWIHILFKKLQKIVKNDH